MGNVQIYLFRTSLNARKTLLITGNLLLIVVLKAMTCLEAFLRLRGCLISSPVELNRRDLRLKTLKEFAL